MGKSSGETLETILVVDDTDLVIEVVVAVLKNANFHVLHADSGANALRLAADYVGRIDFLLSDVKMPGMNGPTLAQRLIGLQPGFYVLFMSGYIKVLPSAVRLDRTCSTSPPGSCT